jgi:hypothetical protein
VQPTHLGIPTRITVASHFIVMSKESSAITRDSSVTSDVTRIKNKASGFESASTKEIAFT